MTSTASSKAPFFALKAGTTHAEQPDSGSRRQS
jgi:hypothetical protein